MYLLSDATPNIDVTSVAWWVTNLGPSGIICFMIWRVLLFLKPIILEHIPYFKEFLVRHFNLMAVAEKHLETQSTQMETSLQNQTAILQNQDVHGQLIKQIHTIVNNPTNTNK